MTATDARPPLPLHPLLPLRPPHLARSARREHRLPRPMDEAEGLLRVPGMLLWVYGSGCATTIARAYATRCRHRLQPWIWPWPHVSPALPVWQPLLHPLAGEPNQYVMLSGGIRSPIPSPPTCFIFWGDCNYNQDYGPWEWKTLISSNIKNKKKSTMLTFRCLLCVKASRDKWNSCHVQHRALMGS